MSEDFNFQKNTEIEQALKEFELKAQAEQVQATPEIQKKSSGVPRMVELVMKWFGIKEQKIAEYVLLGFCVVAIGVSLYLFFGNSVNSTSQTLSPEDLKNLPPEFIKAIQNAK